MPAKSDQNQPEKIDIRVQKRPSSDKPSQSAASDEQLDGGFAAAMHQPGEVVHPEDNEPEPVDASTKPEPDTVYESDEEFYTSKLDLDARDINKTEHHKPAKPSQTDWLRLGFLIVLFIATAIAGLLALYQLEQAQPGAGIIFDWF